MKVSAVVGGVLEKKCRHSYSYRKETFLTKQCFSVMDFINVKMPANESQIE